MRPLHEAIPGGLTHGTSAVISARLDNSDD